MKHPRRIIVIPRGGLANRMRVIASVVLLMTDCSDEIEIRWTQNRELNCSYDQLFTLNKHYNIIVKQKLSIIDYLLKYSCIISVFKILNNKKKTFHILGNDVLLYRDSIKKLKIKTLQKETIYINTCHNLFSESKGYDLFLPQSKILLKVNDLADRFNDNTYGIHIRRTDNFKSIINSPDTLFIKKIEDLIKNNSDSNFYLATDSVELENVFLNIFGHDKIITQKKILDRNNPQGIIDAYVDMVCLSKTKEIFGSYYSSFSEVASIIGKTKLTILKNA